MVVTAAALDPLDDLIDGTLEQLDITRAMHDTAVRRYQAVGGYCADRGARSGVEVFAYPQGSHLLGTPVLPLPGGDCDIDLVVLHRLGRDQISPDQLKLHIGLVLRDFRATPEAIEDGPIEIHDGTRAWTLRWPPEGFHVDVLPAIPDADAASDSAILLPDRELVEWQDSDPRAYARWFVMKAQRIVLKEARAQVDVVPAFGPRNTLQRAVQVLKRHRDIYFQYDDENKPASIIITTLAGLAYDGRAETFNAIVDVVDRMEQFIEHRAGVVWVQNPVARRENFAHRWAAYPVREQRFYAWVGALKQELGAAGAEGWPAAVPRFKAMLGEEPVQKAAERFGERSRELRERGALTVGPTSATLGTGGAIRVPQHTFYGT